MSGTKVVSNVLFRKMTADEFTVFTQYSIRDYAREMALEQNLSATSALARAKAEFLELLPYGPDTEGQQLMIIEGNGQAVGAVWFMKEELDGVHHIFVNDFVIFKAHRRKGYGRSTMQQLEHIASKTDCSEIRLFVAAHNSAAQAFYRTCGYTVFLPVADGAYMHKQIL